MAVTREQAERAMAQLAEEFSRMGPALAEDLGVDSVSFQFGGTITQDSHPYWTATTRKGTTIHRAGPAGLTVDPCHRSMLAGGMRLTRAEVDAIEGHTWCSRCGGKP